MENVANSVQVGTTVVSVEQLLAKEAELNSIREAKNAADALVAAKDQVIEQLQKEVKDTQKVIVYEENRNDWRGRQRRLVETTNLQSVLSTLKLDTRTEVEEEVKDELSTLRLFKKTAQQEREEIIAEKEAEINRLRSRVEEKYYEGRKEVTKELTALKECLEELKDAHQKQFDKAVKEKEDLTKNFASTVTELNLQLKDKSEQQKVEKEIAAYKQTIKDLTDLVKASWLNRVYNSLTGKTSRSFEKINTLMRDILFNQPSQNAVKTVVPSFLNQYAANKIYKVGSQDEVDVRRISTGTNWCGDKIYQTVGTKIQWIAVEV